MSCHLVLGVGTMYSWRRHVTPVIWHTLKMYIDRWKIDRIIRDWHINQVLIIEDSKPRLLKYNQINSVEKTYLPISNLLRDAFLYCRNPRNVKKYYTVLVLSSNDEFKFYIIPRDWEQIKQ